MGHPRTGPRLDPPRGEEMTRVSVVSDKRLAVGRGSKMTNEPLSPRWVHRRESSDGLDSPRLVLSVLAADGVWFHPAAAPPVRCYAHRAADARPRRTRRGTARPYANSCRVAATASSIVFRRRRRHRLPTRRPVGRAPRRWSRRLSSAPCGRAGVAREVVAERTVRRADFRPRRALTRFDEVHRQRRNGAAECELDLVLSRAGEGEPNRLAAHRREPARQGKDHRRLRRGRWPRPQGNALAKAAPRISRALVAKRRTAFLSRRTAPRWDASSNAPRSFPPTGGPGLASTPKRWKTRPPAERRDEKRGAGSLFLRRDLDVVD